MAAYRPITPISISRPSSARPRRRCANASAAGRGADVPASASSARFATDPSGPHPLPQYEIHFLEASREAVIAMIEASGLPALVHPLTDDDLADHTSLAHWIGEPLELDLSVLDPPGVNQGMPRFGKTDF